MDLSKFNATSDTFSDFIVYVDESGDHSLTSIDPEFPVFVLAFCVFHKQHYAQQVVPNVEQLKFGHFGHDLVILHERDIRKRQGDFSTFRNKAEPSAFIDELSAVMTDNNYIIISCVVDKYKLSKQTAKQEHPYHIALKICLERLYEFLIEHNQQNKLTHVVVEKRGRKEDTDLELEFRRICDEDNKFNTHLPFAIRLANKPTQQDYNLLIWLPDQLVFTI